ncbi:MAG: class I SAM-dependent methyltransferase, partial [Solirubrobacterales bacterium]
QYWDARPCNIRHSPKPVGSREYFDEVEARKYFVEPHIPAFAEFERWNGKKVLEIGCGIGTDTMRFARAGAHVTAVDLSQESLAVAARRATVFGLEDRVTFYQADAERLSDSVPVETYDLVYSFGVIHHTPHPENAIAEIRRYMGPGSTLKLMVYHRYSYKVLWILLKYGKGAFWKLDELVARHSEAQTGCPVTYTYSRKSVRDLAKGFTVDRIMVDHIFPYRIPEYTRYQYKKVWYFGMLPAPVFRWLENRAGWQLCLDASLNSAGAESSS